MRNRLSLIGIAFTLLVPWSAFAQEAQCPSPAELQRRMSSDALRAVMRQFAGENRTRVVRVTCEVRDKDAQQAVAVAHVANYGNGTGLELTFAGGDLERASVQPMRGRPQSSAEEREEARAIIRERMNVPDEQLEGGFVVDPPEGSAPGRYLEFHVTTRDRKIVQTEVIVNLSRGDIAARRAF
ncbi:MAG TPA: hypothetical protein VJZ00_08735 [Thermoanaerobaculia bacterium]|nr:hypothetical protein [Thermoanaerobaculia bacterium]